MNHTRYKMTPFVKWHGGKFYLARRFIKLMPDHKIYVEPYLGGGNVFLNKNSVMTEVISDINPELICAWKAVQNFPDELMTRLKDVKYDEPVFLAARDKQSQLNRYGILAIYGTDYIGAAADFIIANRMSQGGRGTSFAWSDRLRGKKNPGGPIPGDLNAWESMIKAIPSVSEALRGVRIDCCPAINQIEDFDSEDTLFYLDPPYMKESRTSPDVYEYEMTTHQHEILLGRIVKCEGTVMVSGYKTDLYMDMLKGWTLHVFKMPNHSAHGKVKQDRYEYLWINRTA